MYRLAAFSKKLHTGLGRESINFLRDARPHHIFLSEVGFTALIDLKSLYGYVRKSSNMRSRCRLCQASRPKRNVTSVGCGLYSKERLETGTRWQHPALLCADDS